MCFSFPGVHECPGPASAPGQTHSQCGPQGSLSGNSSDEGCHGLLSFHSQEMASPPDLQRGVVDHAPIHCSVSLCCPRCCMTPFSCFSIQFPWQILLEMCFLCIFCIFSLFIFRGNHITEADPIHHVGSSSPWQSQDLEDSL